MRGFGNKEAQLRAALANPRRGSQAIGVEVFLGDLNISATVEEAKWGSADQSSPTLIFEGKVAGYLPWEYNRAPLEVRTTFAGVTITEFRGVGAQLKYEPDNATSIKVSTPGAYLDKVPLGRFVTYTNALPETVIRDAIFTLKSYNRGDIKIEPFGRPLVNFSLNSTATGTQQGFAERDFPSSMLSRVFEMVGAVAVDSRNAGFRCFYDPLLGTSAPLADHFRADEVLGWNPPEIADPDEQYTSVVVSQEDSGQVQRILASQSVNWKGYRYPPPEDIPLFLPFTDVGANSADRAANLAMRTAQAIGAGEHKTTFSIPYNPFLEKWDVIGVTERFRDDHGPWLREWIGPIPGGVTTHFSRGEALITTLSVTLTTKRKERIRETLGILPGVVAARVTHGVAGHPVGVNENGGWIDLAEAYDWAGEDAGGFWIDTSLSGVYAGVDGTGPWIDPAA